MRLFARNKTVWALCVLGAALAGAGYFWVKPMQTRANNELSLEYMTWPEVHAALNAGYTTVIIPTGGTEQNGPHAALGKHNFVVAHTSRQIAQDLGKTLVAPVIKYVPEGEVKPNPTGHMQWPGTISVPEPVFEELLVATIRSLATHGFNEILLIGDSGGNQAAQDQAAASMTLELAPAGVTVRHVSDYYADNGQVTYLQNQGFSAEQIGNHAALRDTSELLYVEPDAAGRTETPVPAGWNTGFDGRPDLATPEIGKAMIQLKIDAALAQIRRFREEETD